MIVRMPMGDRRRVAVMDYSDEDDERRGENDDMDDLEEDESDEEESDNDDDEEDESDDGIESEEEEEVHDESVHKFIRTFSNGDYDQEFDNTLNSDRGVIPPVRPTQASYNKPDDWRERNQIGLMNLQEQLQTCIDSVTRDKNVDLKLIHNSYQDQLMDNEEPIVWHEPILDEYWNRLEAKMNQLDIDTKIGRIEITNVEMTKECMAALVKIFRSGKATNSSTFVYFDNANLCADGIISLSEYVDVSSELQVLRLCHNRIDNMESARCFSRSLKSHTRINDLVLTNCDLGRSPEILLVILQSDVRRISLGDNNIDSLGAVQIAEYLEGDPPIEVLSLGHNRLNDDDAILISQALKRNTNLMGINLLMNNFTSIGVKAFLTCVFDSSSLNSMSESNHALGGMNMFWRGNNETSDRLQRCIDRLLRMDWKEKILLALNDKESLLKYLANIPVELMSEVLAFSQLDGIECDCINLSIVYSTMRWWNMPMLYSFQSETKRKRDD